MIHNKQGTIHNLRYCSQDEEEVSIDEDTAKHLSNHATMYHRLGCNSSAMDEVIAITSTEGVTITMAIL